MSYKILWRPFCLTLPAKVTTTSTVLIFNGSKDLTAANLDSMS
jgi:hypothetical protein